MQTSFRRYLRARISATHMCRADFMQTCKILHLLNGVLVISRESGRTTSDRRQHSSPQLPPGYQTLGGSAGID